MIHRYLARQLALTLLIVAPALCLLVALLQAMRLLPLVAAAGLGLLEAAQLLALLLVPIAAVTLPVAAVITLLLVLGRLEGDGELLAMNAGGAGPLRISLSPALIGLTVALVAGALTLVVEPGAHRSLQDRLGEILVRSALGRVREGVLVEPVPELTVLVSRRRGEQLERLFLEDRRRQPATSLFAERARLSPAPERRGAHLVLERGTLSSGDAAGRRLEATFDRLEVTLELAGATAALSSILPERLGASPAGLWAAARGGGPGADAAALLLHRRLAVAPGALGLCLLALALGLTSSISGRPLAVVLGAALVLGDHLLIRLGEALVEAGALGAAAGGWLPVAALWLSLGAALLLRRRRRVCFRK